MIETAQKEVARHLTRELEATGVFKNVSAYRELLAGFSTRFHDLAGRAGDGVLNRDPNNVPYPVG